ncbi:MAG: hypothetical protein RLZZ501_1917, partial [Pseudomonadota bacterium]
LLGDPAAYARLLAGSRRVAAPGPGAPGPGAPGPGATETLTLPP